MSDTFKLTSDSVMAPARAPFAITPHDSNGLPTIPKAIYIGTGGTLVLRGIDGTADATFVNLGDGQVLDVRASHVRATGTTAANLIGLA